MCSLVLFTWSSSCRLTEKRSLTRGFAVTARHEGNHEYCFDAMTLRGRKIERDSGSRLRMTLREISVVLDVRGPWHRVMDRDERWRARLAFDRKIPSKGADYRQQSFSYTCVLRHAHEGGEKKICNDVSVKSLENYSIDSMTVYVLAFQSGRGMSTDVDEGWTLRLMRLLISLVKLRDITYGTSRLDTWLRKLRSTITTADYSRLSNLSLSSL